MAGGVVESGDRAVVSPQDENRPGTDLESAVVAALGNFGLAGHEQPVTAEEVFELGRIQPLIGEERTREGETGFAGRQERSEEHTSELQSRLHLVCRLLLEKK